MPGKGATPNTRDTQFSGQEPRGEPSTGTSATESTKGRDGGANRTESGGQDASSRHLTDADLTTKVERIYALLVGEFGIPQWEPDHDALGGLIATVLSQHTSDTNSARAFASLRAAFPSWEAVRDAPLAHLEAAIRSGGLARQKAPRIQEILRALTDPATGNVRALNGLADEPLDQALAYLKTLPGVGPKTAACVLLFSLGRPAFPVDTHVWRVAKRLGLLGAKVGADAAHDVLQAMIPPEWRHTMHVDLIRHGRQVCHARHPACFRCPLRKECNYYWVMVVPGQSQV